MNQVVIYTHEFHPEKGGIATVVEEVAYALKDQGIAVTVFAPKLRNGTESFKKFPFTVFPLNNKGTQGWWCRLITMISILKNRGKIKKSILYVPEPGPLRIMFYLCLLNLIQAKKIVVTLHGSEVIRLTRSPLNKWLMGRFLSKNVHTISVLSNYCRELLLGSFPRLAEKTLICDPGVRRGITPIQGKKEFNKDKVILLTVARIHPRKSQLLVLKAIKKLQEMSNLSIPIEYWVVGPAIHKGYAKRLRTFGAEHGLNVIFHGDVKDAVLNKCYESADIFIMTSEPHKNSIEGFGLVYLEAMAKGLPIIAKETGGVGECVKKGSRNILIAEKAGETEMAEALRKMIDSCLRDQSQSKDSEQKPLKIASWDKFALRVIGRL